MRRKQFLNVTLCLVALQFPGLEQMNLVTGKESYLKAAPSRNVRYFSPSTRQFTCHRTVNWRVANGYCTADRALRDKSHRFFINAFTRVTKTSSNCTGHVQTWEDRASTWHDSRKPFQSGRGFYAREFRVRFVAEKVALTQVFFRVRGFFPRQVHSINAPYSLTNRPPTLYNLSN